MPLTINFKVKTVFTNNLEHLSATASAIVLICGDEYVMSESPSATTPQYVPHDDASVGFILPAYVTTQQAGCPTHTPVVISQTSAGITAPVGLEDPVLVGSDWIIKPTDITAHADYSFFVYVTADGGSTQFLGGYSLKVGCTSTSVTLWDSGSFDYYFYKWVGGTATDQYILYMPYTNRAWCVAEKNVILNDDQSIHN